VAVLNPTVDRVDTGAMQMESAAMSAPQNCVAAFCPLPGGQGGNALDKHVGRLDWETVSGHFFGVLGERRP
jgi:hypothetical protein